MKVFRYIVISIAVLILLFSAGYILVGYFFNNNSNTNTNIISKTPVTESEIESIKYSLEEPPSQSLRGKIATMSGEIHWQSRTATESSQITDLREIVQGETLWTKDSSQLKLVFDTVCGVEMSENTTIDVVQTLPVNLVFRQSEGLTIYEKTGEYPLSVRSLSLLSDIDGKTEISIDGDKNIIYVNVVSGSTTIAHNDADYVSHQLQISEGQTYSFNHDNRKGVLR